MILQLHIFAWALVVSMTALAATSVFCAVDALDGMVHRWRDRRHIRHGRLPLQALEPDGHGYCPWCQVRECMDVTSCTCDGPCGMPLCQALETETAP